MTVRINQSFFLPCKGLHNQGHIGFVDVVVDKVLLASVMGQPTRAFISARLTAARVFLNQYMTLLTSNGLRPRRDSKAFSSRTYSSTYFKEKNKLRFILSFFRQSKMIWTIFAPSLTAYQ